MIGDDAALVTATAGFERDVFDDSNCTYNVTNGIYQDITTGNLAPLTGQPITYFTHHNYDATSLSSNYVPLNTTYENTSTQDYNQILIPKNGTLKTVMVHVQYDSGITELGVHVNGVSEYTHSHTIDAGAYQEFVVYETISKGDLLQISINPTTAPRDVHVTCEWEYDA